MRLFPRFSFRFVLMNPSGTADRMSNEPKGRVNGPENENDCCVAIRKSCGAESLIQYAWRGAAWRRALAPKMGERTPGLPRWPSSAALTACEFPQSPAQIQKYFARTAKIPCVRHEPITRPPYNNINQQTRQSRKLRQTEKHGQETYPIFGDRRDEIVGSKSKSVTKINKKLGQKVGTIAYIAAARQDKQQNEGKEGPRRRDPGLGPPKFEESRHGNVGLTHQQTRSKTLMGWTSVCRTNFLHPLWSSLVKWSSRPRRPLARPLAWPLARPLAWLLAPPASH